MALASLAGRTHSTPQEKVIDRSLPGKVTGRLKRAMDALVWEGLPRAQAAAKGPMSEHSLYDALRRPHVRAYYLQQLEVLRLSTRARNIRVLEEIRDDDANQMARVQAIKALEQMSDAAPATSNDNHLPGLTIRIIGTQPPMIDVTPSEPDDGNEAGT